MDEIDSARWAELLGKRIAAIFILVYLCLCLYVFSVPVCT